MSEDNSAPEEVPDEGELEFEGDLEAEDEVEAEEGEAEEDEADGEEGDIEEEVAVDEAREAGNQAAGKLIAQGLIDSESDDDQSQFTRVEDVMGADFFTQEDEDALAELEDVVIAQAQRAQARMRAAQIIEEALRAQEPRQPRGRLRPSTVDTVNVEAVETFTAAARMFQTREGNQEPPALTRPPTPYPRSRESPPASSLPKGKARGGAAVKAELKLAVTSFGANSRDWLLRPFVEGLGGVLGQFLAGFLFCKLTGRSFVRISDSLFVTTEQKK